MLRKNDGTSRCKSKMRRWSVRISTNWFLQRSIWNWWRTDWVRVECFPRTYVIGNLPKNPERLARTIHWTWKFWRLNHLHVDVQWHWLDENGKFRTMFFKFWTRQELREEIHAGALDWPGSEKKWYGNDDQCPFVRLTWKRRLESVTLKQVRESRADDDTNKRTLHFERFARHRRGWCVQWLIAYYSEEIVLRRRTSQVSRSSSTSCHEIEETEKKNCTFLLQQLLHACPDPCWSGVALTSIGDKWVCQLKPWCRTRSVDNRKCIGWFHLFLSWQFV